MNNQIKNSRVIGIDLGTTYTVAAFLDDAGKPKVIPNFDGELKMPSVVFFGRKERLVGNAARNMQCIEPERTLVESKRDIGTDRIYFKEGGEEITPGICLAEILKCVRLSAMKYFGDDLAAGEAVVSVPAYFAEKERQCIKHAAGRSGIKVIALVNEPTAAGLAYGVNEAQGDRLIEILDFGGGTFDASLISFTGGEANVLASHGDKQLGGKDVDEIILSKVREAFKREHGLDITPASHPADWFNIRDQAINQKHALYSRTEVKLCARVDGKSVALTLTRQMLNEAIKPLMERAERVMLETIANAKVERSDIKHVLLVGGSSRLHAFQATVSKVFGSETIVSGQTSPDLAIAEGAALLAAKLVASSGKALVGEALQAIPAPSIKYTDVMPHSLGISVADRVSAAPHCSVILERNQPLPCTATRSYGSLSDEQTVFRICVAQGENQQPIKDCLVVAERELQLPPRKATEPSIEVTMGYDVSGMVKVTVKDLVSKKAEDITVDFYGRPAVKGAL